jgi:hypothetical protein
MKFLKLSGKTRHGKNRVNQHGIHWQVIAEGNFRGQPAWLVSSLNKTDKGQLDRRWILKENDPNFEEHNWFPDGKPRFAC